MAGAPNTTETQGAQGDIRGSSVHRAAHYWGEVGIDRRYMHDRVSEQLPSARTRYEQTAGARKAGRDGERPVSLDLARVRISVRPGITDMRRQINGLATIVQEGMGGDPLGGSLYLFQVKGRRVLKAVYWDRNGFCLWQKRLERDRFPWPGAGEKPAGEVFVAYRRALIEPS